MTELSAQPVDPDQLDLLDLVADNGSALAHELADEFHAACWAEAIAHDGWINPNRVHARLRDQLGEFNKQQYSALWATACGRDGFLDKSDRRVPIASTVSRGNGNKSVPLRRWRGWHADSDLA